MKQNISLVFHTEMNEFKYCFLTLQLKFSNDNSYIQIT